MRSACILLCVSVLAAPMAGAQGREEPPASDPEKTEPVEETSAELKFEEQVVVTAGKVEQRIGDVPVQVTVVSADEILRSPAQTVADVLLQVPAFNMQRGQSSRVATPPTQAISLRSMGSSGASRTLVVVDGVPLNDPFFGWIAWSQVSPSSVERIEVVPAGGAGAWGNQALGGVINIITRRPERALLEADARFGSLETVDLGLAASHVVGPVSFSARGSFFDTDGYIAIPEETRGPVDTPSASRTRLGEGRLEYSPSPAARWMLRGSYLDDDRTTGTPLSVDRAEVYTLRAGGDLSTSRGHSWRLSAFGQWRDGMSTRGSEDDTRSFETPSRDQFDVPSSSLGAGVSWSRPLRPRHLLSAGADFQWTEGEVHDDSRYLSGAFTRRSVTGGEQALFGAYLQDTVLVGSRWRVSAGSRLDMWRSFDGIDFLRDLSSGAVLEDTRFPARTLWILSPNLGVVHHASDRVSLRAAAYRTFRAPTPNELFKPFATGSRAINEANPNLDPERVTAGFEAGLDLTTGPFTGRATGFWNEISGAITDVTVGRTGSAPGEIAPCGLLPARGTCRQKQNLERLRNRGVELELRYRPHRRWHLATAYIFASSKVARAPNEPDLVGRRLRRVPEHQASLRAEYVAARVATVSLQARYLGHRYGDDLNTEDIEDSVVVDLSLSRRLGRRLDLFVAAENLLDTAFQVDDGPEYGHPRMLHVGVRFRWRGAAAAVPAP